MGCEYDADTEITELPEAKKKWLVRKMMAKGDKNCSACREIFATYKRETNRNGVSHPSAYIKPQDQYAGFRHARIDKTTLPGGRGWRRRLTEKDIPRSMSHSGEQVVARRRLLAGICTPSEEAELMKLFE